MNLNRKYLEDFGEVLEISDTNYIVLSNDIGIQIKENAVYPVEVKGREPLTIATVGHGVSYPDRKELNKALRDGIESLFFFLRNLCMEKIT